MMEEKYIPGIIFFHPSVTSFPWVMFLKVTFAYFFLQQSKQAVKKTTNRRVAFASASLESTEVSDHGYVQWVP